MLKSRSIWIILSIVLVGVIFYLVILPIDPEPQAPDLNVFKEQKLQLQKEISTYKLEIQTLKKKQAVYEIKIDSLLNFKTQIKYVYINEQTKIDSLNNNELVNEFTDLFSKLKID
jgi:hypothetical protein